MNVFLHYHKIGQEGMIMATKYPYDPSGLEPSNSIVNELHSVQPPANITHASFTVALLAPFFMESFEIWTGINKTGKKLVLGTDYLLTHKFVAGSNQTGRMLYASVTWINQAYTGNVYFNYNTLGGDFTVNDVNMVESITNQLYKQIRFVTWDQIEGVPSAFPPDAHHHTVNDVKTFIDVEVALRGISAAILALVNDSGSGGDTGAMALIRNHLSQTVDAHTKEAVGLGNVSNFPMAVEQDAQQVRNDRMTSPGIVQYMINRAMNNENLGELRDSITTIENAIENITTSLQNTITYLAQLDESLSQQDNRISDLNESLVNINENIARVDMNANNAIGIANSAASVAAAAEANMKILADRTNRLVFVGTRSYGTGSHVLIIPARTAVRINLIGAGGGSGMYYESVAQLNKYGGRSNRGGDSILYALGLYKQPIEPYPILVAGAGESGNNNFPDGGLTYGGDGGKASFITDRVKVSDLIKPVQPSLVAMATVNNGINGTNGDSGNDTNATVPGVGGFKLNDSGDLSKQIYGKGRAGVRRGGLGGSGAKAATTVENDTDDDFFVQLVIGSHGISSKPITNVPEHIYDSNGVGFTTLVG